MLPQQDYMALLSAALRGPAWASGALTTGPLFSDVTQFTPAPPTWYGQTLTPFTRRFMLASFVGWGVEMTNTWVVPEVPLPACTQLLDFNDPQGLFTRACPTMGANTADAGSNKQWDVALGLGLGIGLGGFVLVVCVIYFAWAWRAERRERSNMLPSHW